MQRMKKNSGKLESISKILIPVILAAIGFLTNQIATISTREKTTGFSWGLFAVLMLAIMKRGKRTAESWRVLILVAKIEAQPLKVDGVAV